MVMAECTEAPMPVSDLSWFFRALSPTHANSSTDELMDAITGINALIRSRNFDLLARILRGTPLGRMTPQMLVAFVRATNPVRSHVPGWRKFVARVRDALNERGCNGELLLKGII